MEQAGPKDLWLEGYLGQRQGGLAMAAVIIVSFGSIIIHWDTWKLITKILEFFLGYLNNPG